MRLRYYRVYEWYTDELRKVSPNGVTINNSNHVNTYVGILFNINDIKYIAPLTHTTKRNKWHQQAIVICDSKGTIVNKLGTILFQNMIPVFDGVYEDVDIEHYKNADLQRYNLYSEQINWVNQSVNKQTIVNKAKQTYAVHFDEQHGDHSFLNINLNCKFSDLEKRMLELQAL